MSTETPTVYKRVYDEAVAAARYSTSIMLKSNPTAWYPCGFAWVRITPARGPFISWLKEQEIGHKDYAGGWTIWNPSGSETQWMDAKVAGAEAFAQVLKKHGFNVLVESRID